MTELARAFADLAPTSWRAVLAAAAGAALLAWLARLVVRHVLRAARERRRAAFQAQGASLRGARLRVERLTLLTNGEEDADWTGEEARAGLAPRPAPACQRFTLEATLSPAGGAGACWRPSALRLAESGAARQAHALDAPVASGCAALARLVEDGGSWLDPLDAPACGSRRVRLRFDAHRTMRVLHVVYFGEDLGALDLTTATIALR